MITNKVKRQGRPWHRKKRNLKKVYHGSMSLSAVMKKLGVKEDNLPKAKRRKKMLEEAMATAKVEHVAFIAFDPGVERGDQFAIMRGIFTPQADFMPDVKSIVINGKEYKEGNDYFIPDYPDHRGQTTGLSNPQRT